MMNFESYLVNKNDEIDNAAFELINAFVHKGTDTDIEWNMEIIGEVEEAVEDVLTSRCFGICHPFYCDEVPCYKSEDCGNTNCPFKNGVIKDA